MTRCLVAGAGIRGIIAADLLRKAGYEVVLADAGDLPGGILCSPEWDGLYLDKGCHLLDFANAELGNFFSDVMREELIPVDRRYASINNFKKSDGIAVPDMSLFPDAEKKQAIKDLLSTTKQTEQHNDSLHDSLVLHFGSVAGNYLSECVNRISAYDARDLSPAAFQTLRIINRIRLDEDAEMEKLKSRPELDDKLAVASESDPLKFYRNQTPFTHRNYYPEKKGMRGFCEAAASYLEETGIELKLKSFMSNLRLKPDNQVVAEFKDGEPIETDVCYWALPGSLFLRMLNIDDPLVKHTSPVSMILYYFRIHPDLVNDYTYIHDFSAGKLCFRASTPGLYGNQIDEDGNTYICAEVPVKINTELWNNPERHLDAIWNELIAMELVKRSATYHSSKNIKMPVAYVLPSHGWEGVKLEHDAKFNNYKDSVIFSDSNTFGKINILQSVKQDLKVLLN